MIGEDQARLLSFHGDEEMAANATESSGSPSDESGHQSPTTGCNPIK